MMSLRGFHIFFIAAAAALAFGVGLAAVRSYLSAGRTSDLMLGIGSFSAVLLLVAYLVWFIWKSRRYRHS